MERQESLKFEYSNERNRNFLVSFSNFREEVSTESLHFDRIINMIITEQSVYRSEWPEFQMSVFSISDLPWNFLLLEDILFLLNSQ